MAVRNVAFDTLTESLKRAAAALRDAEVPYMLGGSIAAWARGGPETTNDIDLLIRPAHADAALDALSTAGMRPERPPEEWLLKAWDGEVMIDLIFILARGREVDDELFERAEEMEVLSMAMLVMDLDDVVVTKLMSLDDHYLDYESLVQIARALREQIDWREVRERTAQSPYARAYFALLEALNIIAPDRPVGEPAVEVRSEESETHAFRPEPEPFR